MKQLLKDWKSLRGIVFKAGRGDSHQARLESFYESQAESYDHFRKKLLKGREDLFSRIQAPAGSVWVDFGAGTGSNLELFGPQISQFSEIHLVDLSSSLLKVAEERIQKHNWQNVRTHLIEASEFRLEKPVDLITFSYSLTMMPNWIQVLENALSLLKVEGQMAVVDFYLSRKHETELRNHSWMKRHFFRIWFERDNVFLNPDHLQALRTKLHCVWLEEKEASLPYLPFLKAPFYQFIGQKRSD